MPILKRDHLFALPIPLPLRLWRANRRSCSLDQGKQWSNSWALLTEKPMDSQVSTKNSCKHRLHLYSAMSASNLHWPSLSQKAHSEPTSEDILLSTGEEHLWASSSCGLCRQTNPSRPGGRQKCPSMATRPPLWRAYSMQCSFCRLLYRMTS